MEEENKVISKIKERKRNYHIIEKFVSGIVLSGSEVKAIRNNLVSIEKSYIILKDKEFYISNMNIADYRFSSKFSKASSENSKKKLLLNTWEILRIIKQSKAKSYSLVPLLLFINKRGLVKLEVALVKYLKNYQIKNAIKEKEIERRMRKKDFELY